MHTGVTARPLIYAVVSVLACLSGACGSTVATSTGPSPAKCAVTLAAPGSPVSSSADTTTVGITTQPECAWSASSDAPWITGLTPSSGQGSAQLQMQIAANPAATARQGDIVVNSERARIRQDAAPCAFELSATEQTIPAAGGTGRITVTATAGCAWSAQADAAWVVLTGGATGTGTGNVTFTIASNSGTRTRAASIVVAGQTVRVTQQANVPIPPPTSTVCSVTVSPKGVSLSALGTNSSSISVTAESSCEWSASTDSTWISLTGRTSGTGNGTVTFGVASNTGPARSGTLTIAGQTVTVNQAAAAACTYSLSSTTLSVAAGGGATGPVTVTTAAGCTWTATSSVLWLSITAGASGTGNGTVSINAAANTGAARTGSLTVANQTVTVNQAAPPCAYSVTPMTVSIGAAGGTGTPISVSTGSGCTWTATTSAGWITILTGGTGTSNGSVTYSVQANTGSARSGMMTVAGQSVTISQNAPCTYGISPMNDTMDKGGGTGTVSVTTQSGCTWTAMSNANWITITSGSGGTGNGTVSFTVAPNTTGNQRNGTLTIAGKTFTLTEKK
jgi:all-beta uncharacterized protein/BACON domain-containing protein